MIRTAWGAAAALLLGAAVPVISPAPPAAADTTIAPTVTYDRTEPDDGELSLREAVALANETPGLDTIALAQNATYVLDGSCAFGDVTSLVITDEAGLILDGHGGTIRQAGTGGFGCEPRVITSFEGPLELRAVTLTGGDAPTSCFSAGCPDVDEWGRGGGVYSEGPLVLDDTTVTGNRAALTGGGVEARSTLVVRNGSSIRDNRGGVGGGIHSVGAVTLERASISGNHAEVHPHLLWVASGIGGGIAADAPVVATDTYVADNVAESLNDASTAPGSAGGIRAPSATLTDTLVTGNEVEDAVTEGAIYPGNGGGVDAGTVVLDRATIAANRAGEAPQVSGTTLTATRSVIGGEPDEVSCVLGGATTSGGLNVVGGGTCGLGGGPGDRTHVPWLRSTPTANSRVSIIPPADCAGDPDRTGDIRPLGGACEAGSEEVGGAAGPHATPTVLSPSALVDVAPNRTDAVDWATTHAVLTGANGLFGADRLVTRGQAVAALWRTFGAPNVGRTGMPYLDVPRGAGYRSAVKWALTTGVLSASRGERFLPKQAVDRATFVTMLWRVAGRPDPDFPVPFPTIPYDAPYRQAANWAALARIVTVDGQRFHPNELQTRAELAQLLFLAASSPQAWTEVDPPPTHNL